MSGYLSRSVSQRILEDTRRSTSHREPRRTPRSGMALSHRVTASLQSQSQGITEDVQSGV